jgi:hypothetical protein
MESSMLYVTTQKRIKSKAWRLGISPSFCVEEIRAQMTTFAGSVGTEEGSEDRSEVELP